MKYSRLFILFIVMIVSQAVKAQENNTTVIWPEKGKNDTIRVAATNDNGYMIPWIGLQEVVIWGKRTFRSPEEQAAFNRLRYNVLKVMPYALYAKEGMKNWNAI